MWTGATDYAENCRDAGKKRGDRKEVEEADNRKGSEHDRSDDKNAIRRRGARQTRDGKKKDGTEQKKQSGANVVAVENLHVTARGSDGHRNHRSLHGCDGRVHGGLFGWNGHKRANGVPQTSNERKGGGDADKECAAHRRI